jgi:hypothetical protein
METKSLNITISIDKAREWYGSGNSELKKLALNAFTKEQLIGKPWQKIKTFEDAYENLGYSENDITEDIYKLSNLNLCNPKHLIAIYKVDIIREALNQNFKPSLLKGRVYYPVICVHNPDGEYNDLYGKYVCADIIIDNECTTQIVNDDVSASEGFFDFLNWKAYANATINMFACKSAEIAEHMGKYFAKEIFDAIYIQYGNYNWIEDNK